MFFLTAADVPGTAQWSSLDSTLFNRATVLGQVVNLNAGSATEITVSAGSPAANSPVMTGWSGTLPANALLVLSARVSGTNFIVTIANVGSANTGAVTIDLFLASINNV